MGTQTKAVAILAQMQAGHPALIQKDGGEMLVAIVRLFQAVTGTHSHTFQSRRLASQSQSPN